MCITQSFQKKNNTFTYLLIHQKTLMVFSGSQITQVLFDVCVLFNECMFLYSQKNNKGIIKKV